MNKFEWMLEDAMDWIGRYVLPLIAIVMCFLGLAFVTVVVIKEVKGFFS